MSTYKQLMKESTSLSGMAGERGGNSSTRWTPGGSAVEIADHRLSGYEQIEFPEADELFNQWADTALHVDPVTSSGSIGGGPTREGGSDFITRNAYHTSPAGAEATADLGFPEGDENDGMPDARVFSAPDDEAQVDKDEGDDLVSESEVRALVRSELKR